MRKKEYIDKLANLIINRVKYHAPKIKDQNIDYALLSAINIDIKYPIFLFNKKLNNIFFRAFLQAKKHCEFNLILTEKPLISDNKIKLLKKTNIILNDEIGGNLFNILQSLNINYLSHSNFEKIREKEYIKFQDKILELEFSPYYNRKKIMLNGAIIDVKKFLLNGKNYICDLLNTRDELIKTSIEINIPLPRGYYVFNKGYDSIEIMNLTTKQKVFFNYSVKKNQAIFSCFDGIESSTFACVNLIFQIELLPKEKKRLFFNLGEEKMSALSAKDMQKFFEMSQNLMNNVFDVKIASHNKAFDNDFNYKLPRLIWESWLNFDFDEKSENEWIKIRNGIVKNNSSGFEINDEYKNLKEVKIFDNDVWKRVFIVHNDCKYLFAGRTKYYNLTLITKEIFSKNNEFYLSFS